METLSEAIAMPISFLVLLSSTQNVVACSDGILTKWCSCWRVVAALSQVVAIYAVLSVGAIAPRSRKAHFVTTSVLVANSKALVATSKALVPTSKALVPTSVLVTTSKALVTT